MLAAGHWLLERNTEDVLTVQKHRKIRIGKKHRGSGRGACRLPARPPGLAGHGWAPFCLSASFSSPVKLGFPSSSDSKESACNAGGPEFSPWVRQIPWRRKWQPTPVFLPGEFHGQRSLAGYSPWGCKRFGHDWATNTHTKPGW